MSQKRSYTIKYKKKSLQIPEIKPRAPDNDKLVKPSALEQWCHLNTLS
jgi:hypothetical protein